MMFTNFLTLKKDHKFGQTAARRMDSGRKIHILR